MFMKSAAINGFIAGQLTRIQLAKVQLKAQKSSTQQKHLKPTLQRTKP
jgi:hypothetical protein